MDSIRVLTENIDISREYNDNNNFTLVVIITFNNVNNDAAIKTRDKRFSMKRAKELVMEIY